MPLFKGSASLSTPHKAIRYITDEKKAALISVRNLFEDENYAQQFKDTANRFGKGKKRDERKYYHFKLSCAQKDKVSPQEAHNYAEELTARLFNDCECVISTHNDTKTVHSHIIVNAVDPITGKKLRFSNYQYAAMKDQANILGKELGYTATDFRKKSGNKRTAEENHIKLKGGTSWKEDLREVIEEAKRSATTKEEFIAHLQLYNVRVTRSISEYSFLHPEKEKSIRGKRLGENYSKEVIENAITENRHRRDGNAITGITRKECSQEGRNGQRSTETSVSDIERKLQQLNRAAEYAHQGADFSNQGNSLRHSDIGLHGSDNAQQGSQENGSGIPASQSDKIRNQANDKKRDYSYSK